MEVALPAVPEDATIVDAVVAAVGRPVALWIFGSAVDGVLRRDSDLDLAVLMPEPLEPLRRFDAAQECAVRLGWDVDLVDLRAAPPALRAAVVGRGRRLMADDENAADWFAMLALSDYARLNEEREPVLRALGVEL